MVNKLYPFEKNRYYPGKMLSSADFQAEQNYLVNKSRFMNHLMYGAGIVCGLSTISLDDLSVLVESGVAIDGEGREIIIGNSVVHKLSAIEGFSSLTGDEASLFIRFREEPVHSVYSVSRGDSDKEYEYNRVQEGYELYLTDKAVAGAEEFLETEFLLRDSVFSSEHFSAEILVPAIVSRGRNMRIRLEIKKRSAEDVRLSLRGVLETPSFTTADGAHELEFSADEVRLGKGEVLYRDYWMYVADEHSAETNVILKSGSATAHEDENSVNAAQNFSIIVRLTDRSPIEIVNDEVGRLSLEMREAAETSDGVRIADIRLSRTKNSYIIEEVRESGVRDYIVSPAQTVLRNFYLEYFTKDVNLSSGGPATGVMTETENRTVRTTMPEIATGVLEISLGKNARAGDIRYSGEIAHGLGRGEHLGGAQVGVEEDLGETLAVAKVDEDEATKVAARADPAGERDRLADVLCAQLAAGVGVHGMLAHETFLSSVPPRAVSGGCLNRRPSGCRQHQLDTRGIMIAGASRRGTPPCLGMWRFLR